MKKRLFFVALPLVILGAVFFRSAGKADMRPAPVAQVAQLSGQENAAQILGKAQSFVRNSKSTPFQANYVIHVSRQGAALPLFPAEFQVSYSPQADKHLYEATSPPTAVGSALLIHGPSILTARVQPEAGTSRNVALAEVTEAEVADGCSGEVCNMDGQCGDCSEAQVAQPVGYKPRVQLPNGTFQRLVNTGVFDLPYLTELSTVNAQKTGQVLFEGEPSSVVSLSLTPVRGSGPANVQVTVRHRDAAPVRVDVRNEFGKVVKTFQVSYVGNDIAKLIAKDSEQNLLINVSLKSVAGVRRGVNLPAEMFTRNQLYKIVRKGRRFSISE